MMTWVRKRKSKSEITIQQIKDALAKLEKENDGDGKAVYLSDMSEDEYDEYVHEEMNGWKGFNNTIKKLLDK